MVSWNEDGRAKNKTEGNNHASLVKEIGQKGREREEKKKTYITSEMGPRWSHPAPRRECGILGIRGAHESGRLVLGDWFPARRRNDQEKDG